MHVPGRPEDSGISLEIIRELGPELPLLGVCMGHQCIGQVFGGSVIRAPCGVMHGKASPVLHSGIGVLQVFSRYHFFTFLLASLIWRHQPYESLDRMSTETTAALFAGHPASHVWMKSTVLRSYPVAPHTQSNLDKWMCDQ